MNKAEKDTEECYNCIDLKLSDEPVYYTFVGIGFVLASCLCLLIWVKVVLKIKDNRKRRLIQYELDSNSSSVIQENQSINLELEDQPNDIIEMNED